MNELRLTCLSVEHELASFEGSNLREERVEVVLLQRLWQIVDDQITRIVWLFSSIAVAATVVIVATGILLLAYGLAEVIFHLDARHITHHVHGLKKTLSQSGQKKQKKIF